MFKNYLKISIRHFLRHRLYSLINVLGLAVGIACCLLIGLFVAHELSYDRHYAKAGRIYRVSRDFFPGGDSTLDLQLATIASQAGELLALDFPQIERFARLVRGSQPVSNQTVTAYERDYWVDPEVFELFDFQWLEGDPSTALAEPYSAVLTESLASKYFGEASPLGQTLMYGNSSILVTGVIRDLPANTHLEFDMLGSISTLRATSPELFNNWGNNLFHTYLLLEEGADPVVIQRGSGAFMERHYEAGASRFTGFSLTPLRDIHLRSHREGEMSTPGSPTAVTTFSAIAVFILLIACFNFMNLATARATQRAKEVGLRKSIGAARTQIVAQFLGESMLMVMVAVTLALIIVELTLPAFSALMATQMDFNYLGDPLVLAGLAVLTLLVGLVAGSYPAFYLSSFRSARVLKGDLMCGRSAATIRKLLVISQFAVTIPLLIATAVVYLQMQYARSLDLGYDREQVVVLSTPSLTGFGRQWSTLKNELLAHPEITSVTASSLTPAGGQGTGAGSVRFEGGTAEGERGVPFVLVDSGFFATYDIALLAGRSFSDEFTGDRLVLPDENNPQTSAAFMLSEMAARQFGWSPEQAVGKWFEVSLGNRFAMSARGPIIGVAANVNFKSIRDPLEPIIYFMPPEGFFRMIHASVEISGRDVPGTLGHIERVWEDLMPGQPLVLRFVDQDFEALYEDEARQAQMFSSFTLLAIAVACLGLLGLATYATERRMREIALRKVLGGSVWSIVLLLTNDFSKLVLLSNVIAWPVAYFAMNRWLENFAYRIDLTPMIFISSGLIALCIAWVTVGGTAAKAASQKPVGAAE